MITNTDLFEVTYDQVFRGQTVDTKRAADCERIWDAAWQAAYSQARAELIAEMRAKPVYWYDPDTPLAIVPEK